MPTQLVVHMTAVAKERARRRADEEAAALETNRVFIDGLIYNMMRRTKKHNIKLKRTELADELHKMQYDETYFDVFDGDDRDYKVRVFFEPLIGCFLGNRKVPLVEIKRALDHYFPIPVAYNREWNPIWKTVPFTPKRKSDKRTRRLTVQFDWSIKKAE